MAAKSGVAGPGPEADLGRTEDRLSTVETATWTYGVRGCEKQGIYVMQSCNQMTRQCTFIRNGEIARVEGQ